MELNKDKEEIIFVDTAGFSMWPFLKQGEKIIIKKVPFQSLKIGDIISYWGNNGLICHRLVKKVRDNGRYLNFARGDNSLSPSEAVSEQSYLGKATGILKNGKIINLTGWRMRFINRLIVDIAPAVSMCVKFIGRYFK